MTITGVEAVAVLLEAKIATEEAVDLEVSVVEAAEAEVIVEVAEEAVPEAVLAAVEIVMEVGMEVAEEAVATLEIILDSL